jgi:hypothetical protein
MKHWQWHPPHDDPGLTKSGIAIGLGLFCGCLVLWFIAKPLLDPPTQPSDGQRGITLSGEGQYFQGLDLQQATEKLVDAIIQIESHGNPNMVGSVGERGLMQIRESTWREVTRKHYGVAITFDRAFEPGLNRQVGSLYLGDLQSFLYQNRTKWRSDLRSLLLASYNAGPERVRKAGFQMKRLPKSVQSYAERGSALHDWYLSEDAENMHQLLIKAAER